VVILVHGQLSLTWTSKSSNLHSDYGNRFSEALNANGKKRLVWTILTW
jgi:hypothetical protein